MKYFLIFCLVSSMANTILAQVAHDQYASKDEAIKIVNVPPVKLQPYQGSAAQKTTRVIQVLGKGTEEPFIFKASQALKPQQPGYKPRQGIALPVAGNDSSSAQKVLVKSISTPLKPVKNGAAAHPKLRIIEQK